ncbi:MAG TPA: septal ring lytic transglycosylase RlpA family protein [Propylenella sp.]
MLFPAKGLSAALVIAASLFSIATEAYAQSGKASWYALTSRTASGERCDPGAMTAAHRSLPFGTKVKVENLNNGRSVVLRINDRGPFIKGRVIDVTKAAAAKLGFLKAGTVPVKLTVLS